MGDGVYFTVSTTRLSVKLTKTEMRPSSTSIVTNEKIQQAITCGLMAFSLPLQRSTRAVEPEME